MGSLKLRYLIAITLYCGGIFWLSHQSEPPIPENIHLFAGADKVAHCLLYAGLGGLVSMGIRRSNHPAKFWVQWYVPVGFAILYGLTDEVHQLSVPERDFEWLDLVADGIGATLAQLSLYIVWRNPREKT